MILSDTAIKKEIENGNISISPEPKIEGSSVDLTLSDSIKTPIARRNENIPPWEDLVDSRDPKSFEYRQSYLLQDIGFYDIVPGEFIIASTNEVIKLGNSISAFVQGRSSWARIGLAVEIAGFVDSGFEGKITLEMYNMSKNFIRIYKDQRICQIVFVRMEGKVEFPYNKKSGSKYLGQNEAQESKIYEDKN